MLVCVGHWDFWRFFGSSLLRPGNVVVFHLAGDGSGEPTLELGLVISVWKGIKSPKLVATECHVNSCMAFRAVSLDILNEDSYRYPLQSFASVGILWQIHHLGIGACFLTFGPS